MPFTSSFMAALAALLTVGHASAVEYEVTVQAGLVYAQHDGNKLVGDLYLPKGRAKAPALVAFHGGAWRAGNRSFYKYWGPFLARNGYALFTADYRLGTPGLYPAAVYDAKAAVQFVHANAAKFDIDAGRIGLMGDSAGGQLAALLALAGDKFTAAYRDDPNAATPLDVKAVVGFYGIYDMLAQWNHDMIVSPHDSITEEFLGVSPTQNPQIYSESSPISYAGAGRKKVRFLLIHGSRDELVDPQSQTGAFTAALTQAGFSAQQLIVPGAAHFWVSEPFENAPGSYGAMAAPALLQFLEGAL